MKILIVLSVLLSLFFASLIAWAVFADPETILESEVIVEAPAPVVFKLLSNPDAFCQKTSMITSIRQKSGTNHRTTTYRFAGKTFPIEEKITLNPSLNRIHFEQSNPQPQALMGNIANSISINPLPDGTVSVAWQFRYSALSLGTRLLNSLFIHNQIQQALAQSVTALSDYIER